MTINHQKAGGSEKENLKHFIVKDRNNFQMKSAKFFLKKVLKLFERGDYSI
tara:strand:- start:160 stop:312 length:153 start_codon:yes stop_codon:yes gene_type:complete